MRQHFSNEDDEEQAEERSERRYDQHGRRQIDGKVDATWKRLITGALLIALSSGGVVGKVTSMTVENHQTEIEIRQAKMEERQIANTERQIASEQRAREDREAFKAALWEVTEQLRQLTESNIQATRRRPPPRGVFSDSPTGIH